MISFLEDSSTKKNLILIEGIPGSGKSTFARFLANQFERNGIPCELYLETTYDHPIIEFNGHEDNTLFLEAYDDRWSKFLDHFPEEEVVVMESAFLQNPMVHLLHKEAEREHIKSLVHKVSGRLSKENCNLIYFYQKDALAAINKMIEQRGGIEYLLRKHEEYKDEPYFRNRQEQGPESHISFFLEYAEIANEIVRELNIPVEIIENSSADDETYQKQALENFDLKYVPDPVLETSLLRKYSGLYHHQEMDLKISVELINDELWIFGNKRLRPKGADQFYLDDISVTVRLLQIKRMSLVY